MGRAFEPERAAAVLGGRLAAPPDTLLVLGSGLSGLAAQVEDGVEVPFDELPGYPPAGVAGHAGRYVAGRLEGRAVLVQAGRFHLYEGHPPEVVCGPVRVAYRLGVRSVVLTNAAGGVNPVLEPGTVMLVEDHLDFTWTPLPWAVPEAGAPHRPPEAPAPMAEPGGPYDGRLRALAVEAALDVGIPLARGVYAAVLGPSYETPAEVRVLARCGADAVGMSTVPEAKTARALGLPCLALSLVTNRAAGVGGAPLSHEEVVAVGREAGGRVGRLLRRIVRDLP